MRNIFRFLRRHSPRTVLSASFAGILSGGASALLVVLVNEQITSAVGSLSWTFVAVAFVVLLAVVSGLNFLSRVLLIRLMQRAEFEMRMDLSRRILATPLRQLEELGSARLFAVLTQDVANLSAALSTLPNLCINAAMLAGCLIYLAWLSMPVFASLIVVLIVTLGVNSLFDRRAGRLFLLARDRFDLMLEHFRGLSEGVKELKLHGARTKSFLEDHLQPNGEELRARNGAAFEAYAVGNTWAQGIFFVFIGFLVVGLPRLIDVPASLLTAYTLTVLFARGPIVSLLDAIPGFRRAGVALRTIERLRLGGDDEPARAAGPAPLVRRIDLSAITHTYYREREEESFMLGPIDLHLEAGELVFLAGGNGSGKTTLAKVLCGLYPPEGGVVTLDGRPVDHTTIGRHRNLFSVVFAEFFLFERLLGLAGPGLDERARHYLELLQLDHKVRVENGELSTTELSRGQRKRLALLTAYLEDRPFYIFDEWAADQDPYFKDVFYRQLLPDLRRRGKGVLVISHDSQYHDVADRVVRLDFGRLEGDDRPAPKPAEKPAGAAAPALPPPPERAVAGSGRRGFWDAARTDLSQAVRLLRKSPGFAAAAIVTLALGIGGNTAMFSLLDAVLLRPMAGVVDPDRLAWVFSTPANEPLSYPDYASLRAEASGAFSGLAAFHPSSFSLARGADLLRVRGEAVSDNYFAVLGVRPALGGAITAKVGGAAETQVVLSDSLWRERFGADPNVVGQAVRLNGFPFTIAGVAPRDFVGTQTGLRTEVWVPLAAEEQALAAQISGKPFEKRGYRFLDVIGRRLDGRSLARAEQQVATVAHRLAETFPETNRGFDRPVVVSASSGDPRLRQSQLPLLALLMGAVALVLLIACANVANLLLVRALARGGEISVRQALGASRSRLISQTMVESLLLALLGGALGLALMGPLQRLVLSFLPTAFGTVDLDLGVDGKVLAFTVVAALVTGLLFGLAPALATSGRSLVLALRGATASGRAGGVRGARLRAALVVAQVALSLALLVGAGLLLRSVGNQRNVDPGFDARNVLLIDFDLGLRGHSAGTGAEFQRQITERLASLPGVRSTALATSAPLGQESSRLSIAPAGRLPGPGDPPVNALTSAISPGYLKTLGIGLLRGRDFSPFDTPAAPLVAIVNEALAARLWPGEDPVGKRISFPAPPLAGSTAARLLEPDVTVVGVVRNGKYVSLGERPQPFLYLALAQKYRPANVLLLRAEGAPLALVGNLRRAVREMDPYLPLDQVRTLREQVETSLWSVRLSATLCVLFGSFALLLAALGIYSVLSQAVVQRRHEIGVRMAIGASRGDVFKLVLRQSLKLALIGVGVGAAVALVLAQSLSGLLVGVSAADPPTFVAIALLLIAIAALAAFLPARRAVRVDPIEALGAQ